MTKTDNTKLINFVFFRQKLITADFWKMVFPDKKKKPMHMVRNTRL